MNLPDLWQTLTQHYAPLVPTAHSLVWIRHALWSLVLAALALLWLRRWVRAPALLATLPWLLALWAWVPGPWGLAYWLGLAFQIPSLVSAFLAVSVVFQRAPIPSTRVAMPPSWVVRWALAAVVLGAVLGLDTFAVFAVSVYPWGFEPMALALAWSIALLPWVVLGKRAMRQATVWSPCAALLVFTLTGWPTGNVWDALLDPWLWLLAVGYLLRLSWRRG